MRIKNSPHILALRFTPKEFCQLASERFVLVTKKPEEITEAYLAWFNDAEVRQHLGLAGGIYDLPKLRGFAQSHNNETSFLFWIATQDDREQPIGFSQLFFTRSHMLAQTSICIGDKAWWGKGVIGEARSAVLDFAFRKLAVEKVFGHCQKPNAAALFNYRAEQWEFECVLKRHHKVGEQRVDLIQFAMFRDEWMRRIDAWVEAQEEAASDGET
ncbi:MAG: GNAT family protein, partial [Pseudomonadota bacterium]